MIFKTRKRDLIIRKKPFNSEIIAIVALGAVDACAKTALGNFIFDEESMLTGLNGGPDQRVEPPDDNTERNKSLILQFLLVLVV